MSAARVPLMITKRMRRDLAGLGFTDDQIEAMTPAEAWQHLGGMPPEEAPPDLAPPEEIPPEPPEEADNRAHGTPHDVELEATLLGSVLIDPALRDDLRAVVRPSDLWDARHRALWAAMLRFDGLPDFESLRADLEQRGELTKAGGTPYMVQLIADAVTSTAYAHQHAALLRELAERRRVLAASAEIARLAYKEGSTAALEKAHKLLAGIEKERPGAPGLAHALLTADDILTGDWPDPVWIIPDKLPCGLAILAGKAKLGKSWLTLQLACAVGAGGMAFGQRVERGPVLYLALEDNERSLLDRMRQQDWPAGLPVQFMTLTQFAAKVGDLRTGGGAKLAELMQAGGYRLVVVDTLSRAVGGDQNDVREMTEALSPLQAIALEHNCAVVLVDHHNKLSTGDALTDILGSTAKGAVADTLLGLYRERGQADAKLTILGRRVRDQTIDLTFDGMTGCWQPHGETGGLEITANRQAILDALRELGRCKAPDVVAAVGRNRGPVFKDLADLAAAGYVTKVNNTYGLAHTQP